MNTAPIVSKGWSFWATLPDDGVSKRLPGAVDLFSRWRTNMAGRPITAMSAFRMATTESLKSKCGAELEGHYIELLRELATRKGMLGWIFTKAQNKIN